MSMKSNLVPESRADKNGKVVVRHVKGSVSGKSALRSIPKPNAEPTSVLQSVRLKEMDSGALTIALLRDVRAMQRDGDVNYDNVFDALDAAAFLHLHQTRSNRKNLPRTPYIEHPLRNTIRAARWGCRDESVLVATLLHDTVEDCSDQIISHYLGRDDVGSLDEHQKRELALGWVKDTFGDEVLHLVKAVSNDVDNGEKKTEQEKHASYANHVRDQIRNDAKVFLVKFADFVDNAVGLHHNNTAENRKAVSRRARKYFPVIDIFEAEFLANPAIRDLVDEQGYASIWEQIQEAKVKLEPLMRQSA
jgi:(p)ppGpp synthase/HD superfamily hydrolase